MKSIILVLIVFKGFNLMAQLDSIYRVLDREANFNKAYFVNNQLKVMGLKMELNGKNTPFSSQISTNLKSSNILEQKIGISYKNYCFTENSIDNSCFISAYNPNEINRYFFKFDSLGNLIFKFKISSDTIFYISKIIQTSDKGYLITGYGANSTLTYFTPLIKINSKGTIDWVKTYSLHPYYDFLGYGLCEANNSYYVLFSKEKRGLSDPAIYDNNYSVFKISTKGDSIKSWIGNKSDISPGYSDILVDIDENIIFSGNKIDSIVLDTPNRRRYLLNRSYMNLIDKNNKIVWEKITGKSSSIWTYLAKIKQLKDGNILAVGINYGINKDDSFTYGYAVKMTKQGQVLWEKNYKSSFPSVKNQDEFDDFVELEDETIIILGNTYREILKDTIIKPQYSRNYGWAVRLNKNGEILKDANSNVEFVDFEEFDIFPNPSSNSIQITKKINTNSKSVVTIYSLDGRIQMSNSIELNHSTIDIQKLPKGIYQVELINDNNSFYRKLIKE